MNTITSRKSTKTSSLSLDTLVHQTKSLFQCPPIPSWLMFKYTTFGRGKVGDTASAQVSRFLSRFVQPDIYLFYCYCIQTARFFALHHIQESLLPNCDLHVESVTGDFISSYGIQSSYIVLQCFLSSDLCRQSLWNMMRNLFLLIFVSLELLQRRYRFTYLCFITVLHVHFFSSLGSSDGWRWIN